MATSAAWAQCHSPLSARPTVKALVDSGVLGSAVPREYCFQEPCAAGVVSAVEVDLPTIDLSLLRAGNDVQRKKAIQDLGKVCEEWGFFLVVNHGVPTGVIQEVLDATQRFFSLPESEKREYAGEHMLDPIRCGTSFNLAVDDVKYWRDYLKMIVHPVFSSPTKPPGFREALLDYAGCVRKMTLDLLRGINESLGLEEHCMETALDLDAGMQTVVENLYPPCPQPELAIGLPPHSDHGLLTVLLQNGVDGLQVMHGGKWVHVRPKPNSFVVNTGDQLEIFSNGKYRSVLHRAMPNNHATRISIAVVQGPSMEACVRPPVQLVSSKRDRVAYRAIKYKDYVEFQQKKYLKEKSALDLITVPVEQ